MAERAPWLTSATPVAKQRAPWLDAPGPGVAEDIANIAPRALRTGTEMIPAGPGELSKGVPWVIRGVLSKLNEMGLVAGGDETMKEFDQGYASTQADTLPGLSDVRKVTDPVLGKGEDVEAQTVPGQFAQTAIENLPGSVLNPGSVVSKIAQWLTSSGLSEGAGQVAEKLNAPEWVETGARMAGGVGGAYTPGAFNKLSRPRPIPEARQPQVELLRARNIPMSAGQITGSKRLMMQEDVAGGVQAHETQGPAFSRAAMEEQGGFPPGTDHATRPAMRAELERMGTEFDRMENLSAAPFDQSLQDDLLQITQDYVEANPTVAPIVENTMNDLARNAGQNGGILTGEAYKNLRTKLNNAIGGDDPAVAGALSDMKSRLDDAIEVTLPPEEQGNWRRVRQQYRDYLPIERAKASAGQQAAEGVINPKQLKTAIKAVEGRREIASGDRPLTALAEAGESVLEKPGSSNTAERLKAQLAGMLTGGVTGAGISGVMSGDPLTTLLSATAGGAALGFPIARDAFVRSNIGQRALARQGPTMAADRQGLAALMAAQREATRQGGGHR